MHMRHKVHVWSCENWADKIKINIPKISLVVFSKEWSMDLRDDIVLKHEFFYKEQKYYLTRIKNRSTDLM